MSNEWHSEPNAVGWWVEVTRWSGEKADFYEITHWNHAMLEAHRIDGKDFGRTSFFFGPLPEPPARTT